MKLSQLKLDPERTVDGVWYDIGEGAKIRVARARNPEFQRYLEQISRPYVRQIRDGALPRETQQQLYIRALARKVLKDWTGITADDGEELPYSSENAEALLGDEFCILRERVEHFADELDTYLSGTLEDGAKNLPSGSNGRPATANTSAGSES